MIGTAPRRPAQDVNAAHDHGIVGVPVARAIRLGRRNGASETRTLNGRATISSSTPASRATTTTEASIRLGTASSPSMMNSPICTVHASPSMKPSTERRWGRGEAAMIRATMYTAANPDVCSTTARP